MYFILLSFADGTYLIEFSTYSWRSDHNLENITLNVTAMKGRHSLTLVVLILWAKNSNSPESNGCWRSHGLELFRAFKYYIPTTSSIFLASVWCPIEVIKRSKSWPAYYLYIFLGKKSIRKTKCNELKKKIGCDLWSMLNSIFCINF